VYAPRARAAIPWLAAAVSAVQPARERSPVGWQSRADEAICMRAGRQARAR
jgi:hypothetical protein